MNGFSKIDPLLFIQPPSLETLKSISKQKGSDKLDSKLQKVSKDFESILVHFMIKSMWNTIPKSSLSGESGGEESALGGYTEIMLSALAEDISAKGNLGISSMIYKQMKIQQGVAAANKDKPDNLAENDPIETVNIKR